MHSTLTDPRTIISFYVTYVFFSVLRICIRYVALYLVAYKKSLPELVKIFKHLFDIELEVNDATSAIVLSTGAMVLFVYCIVEVMAIVLESRVFTIFFIILDWITCILLFSIYNYLGHSGLLFCVLFTIIAMVMTGLTILLNENALPTGESLELSP